MARSRPFPEPSPARVWLRFGRDFCRREANGLTRSSGFLPPRIPSSARGHASGLSGALRHGVVLLRLQRRPQGLRFLPEQVCKPRQRAPHKLLPGPAEKALLGTWEPGPLAGFAKGDPSRIREIQRNGDHHHVLRTKSPSSASSATTQKFAPMTTAASPLSRWQPRAPTRRTASTSRTPNGTVAWSSARSSQSSPPR